MICCPFHGDSDPSLGVVVTNDLRVPLGTWNCLGCGEKGSWNKLAEKIGADSIVSWNTDDTIHGIPNEDYEEMLGTNDLSSLPALLRAMRVEEAQPWPAQMDWRGYEGQFLQSIGGMIVNDDRNDGVNLLLPVIVTDKIRGAVRANYAKTKGQSSYYTSKGPWVKKWGLFPYDWTKRLIRTHKLDFVFFVEGPRDALRLLREGIPAVATLGANNFSSMKALLLGNLADRVYVLTDNDNGGDKMWETASPLLKEAGIDYRRMKLPKKLDGEGKLIKMDPNSMPMQVLERILRLLNKRHGFKIE